MRIKIKSFICLCLSLAMILVMFSGCGKEPVSSPTDVTPQSVVTPWENKSETSEDAPSVVSTPSSNVSSGEEIITIPISPDPSSIPSKEEAKPIAITFRSIYGDQYTGETGMGKLWKDHFGKMAEKGIVTSFSELDPDTAVDTITREVFAGKATTDVFEVSLEMSRKLTVKKSLANITASKTFRLNQFENNGSVCNVFEGKTYGLTLNANGDTPLLVYNKAFFQQYAPNADIPQLIAKNQWNSETVRELVKQCTKDLDGNRKNDIYGLTGSYDWIYALLCANAGGFGVMREGKVLSAISTEKGEDALLCAKMFFNTDKTWKFWGTHQRSVDNFALGNLGMLATTTAQLPQVAREIPFAWGIAPVPTIHGQTNPSYCVMNTRVFVVPLTAANRLNDIGEWFNKVAEINPQLMRAATKGWDTQTVATYQDILNRTTVDYGVGVLSEQSFSMIDALVTTAVKTPFPNRLAGVNKAIQNELDEFYAPLYAE